MKELLCQSKEQIVNQNKRLEVGWEAGSLPQWNVRCIPPALSLSWAGEEWLATRVQTSRFCSNILAWSNQLYTKSLHAQTVSKLLQKTHGKTALASLSKASKLPLPAPTTGTSRLTLRYVNATCDMAQCFCSVFCKNRRGFLSGKTHQGKETFLSIEYIIWVLLPC